MSFAYHYYAGADGLRCCYAAEPTYRCPIVELDELRLQTQATAALLRCDVDKLARIFDRAHRRPLRKRDDDGKFTGRCAACGAKLDRVGFAAWKERDRLADDDEFASGARSRIAERLGLRPPSERLGPTRYFPLKRDAMDWCREEAKISLSAAAESKKS